MKLKIKDAIIYKQILDLPMMNAIITIAKDKGCDIDGDIVHIGEDSYYVHIFNNEVAECYMTNKIDRIIHVLSIIAYLAIEVISLAMFYYLSWDIIHCIIFNDISLNIIQDIAYLVFLSIFTICARMYLTRSGVVSAYIIYQDPYITCRRFFILEGFMVVFKKAICIVLILLIIHNIIEYGFGLQILFHLQYIVVMYRATTTIRNISILLSPNPMSIIKYMPDNVDNKSKKAVYYLYYGKEAIPYINVYINKTSSMGSD